MLHGEHNDQFRFIWNGSLLIRLVCFRHILKFNSFAIRVDHMYQLLRILV